MFLNIQEWGQWPRATRSPFRSPLMLAESVGCERNEQEKEPRDLSKLRLVTRGRGFTLPAARGRGSLESRDKGDSDWLRGSFVPRKCYFKRGAPIRAVFPCLFYPRRFDSFAPSSRVKTSAVISSAKRVNDREESRGCEFSILNPFSFPFFCLCTYVTTEKLQPVGATKRWKYFTNWEILSKLNRKESGCG